MNRKQLLESLRKSGYSGPEKLGSVLKWAADKEIVTPDGKSVDIEGIWEKNVYVTADTTEELERVELVPPPESDVDDEEKMDDEEDDEEKSAKLRRKSSAPNKAVSTGARIEAGRINTRSSEAKRYNRRAAQYGVGKTGQQTAFSDADGAELFGAYFRLTVANMKGYSYALRADDEAILRKSHVTTDIGAGGAFVHPEISAELIDLVQSYGVARKLMGVESMSGEPKIVNGEDDGITTSWIVEGSTIDRKQLDTFRIELIARKLGGIAFFSSEILNDSAISLGDLASRRFAERFSREEDRVVFSGTGSAADGGITGFIPKMIAESSIGLVQASGNEWDEIDPDDIYKLLGALPHFKGTMRTAFAGTKLFYHTVLLPMLKSGVATSTADVANAFGVTNNADGADASFFGVPYYFVQDMSAAFAASGSNSTVPLLYGDFGRAGKFGMVNGSVSIATSDQFAFDTDEIAIRALERVAVNIHSVGDATKAGAVVGLQMAAS